MFHPKKIIFAGTPEFAVPCLQGLIDADYEIVGVYTQPDRPAGRRRQLQASPVKQLALANNLPIFQPATLKDPQAQAHLQQLDADVMIVVAYGMILPTAVLDIPPLGCINVHASLLPRWRGAAPIQQALIQGDDETGVTIMQMDQGLDTGDMLLKERCAISSEDTSETLFQRLSLLGQHALINTLADLNKLKALAIKQNEAHATYAHKIEKSHALIDWHSTAIELDRKIRGFIPWPVAQSQLQGETIRIWQATPQDQNSQQDPGTIVTVGKKGIDVATGHGILTIHKLQFPGGRPLSCAEALNGKGELLATGNQFR